jgi:peroxiredoxin
VTVPALEVGALAYPFTLLGLDGREYSVPSPSREPLVLVFFRSGCPTCDITFPYLTRLRETYPEGWSLWAISQDGPQKANAYAARLRIDFPVLIDAPALQASGLYDPPSTPTVYLVSPEGRIDFLSEGFAKDDLNALSAAIALGLGREPVAIAAAGDGVPEMKPGCMARQRFPFKR